MVLYTFLKQLERDRRDEVVCLEKEMFCTIIGYSVLLFDHNKIYTICNGNEKFSHRQRIWISGTLLHVFVFNMAVTGSFGDSCMNK